MSLPHVSEWWPSPDGLDEMADEYLPYTNCTSTTKAFVAQLGQDDIGFIQSYVVMGAGDGWWENERDPGARGVDQFLADPSKLNQGLGTAMIRAFLAEVFREPEVTVIQADPRPDNQRATRSYVKAGFLPIGQVTTPDGVALLMRCGRSNFASGNGR